MNNLELAIKALEQHIDLDELDDWGFAKRMRIRQTIENTLIILRSEKESQDDR